MLAKIFIFLKKCCEIEKADYIILVRDLRPTLTKEVGIEADSPPKKYSKAKLKVRI